MIDPSLFIGIASIEERQQREELLLSVRAVTPPSDALSALGATEGLSIEQLSGYVKLLAAGKDYWAARTFVLAVESQLVADAVEVETSLMAIKPCT